MSNSFGTWIKRRRKALDMTQQELAQRMGCSLSTLFKIESDERRPSRQMSELLIRHLEIPSDQQPLFLKVARKEKAVDTLGELPKLESPLLSLTRRFPLPPNSLIGRTFELAEITRLIQEPQCRLLTLTGQGGIGKTHLALYAGSALEEAFEDGVFFINLVPVLGREQTVTAIADAMGIVLYSASDRSDQLLAYLLHKKALLIVDNFEHLTDDTGCTGLLLEIMQRAPRVKLVATSRQSLQLQAEWVLSLQGLPAPKSNLPDELETNSAVELFIQKAKHSNVGFIPNQVDMVAIAQICELVEGLPLGIELAAAWVGSLSCREIVDEIQRSMSFLETTMRDLPERHRSLRATVEHSWKLLSAEEQRILRQSSIFRGGFTRQAAEVVLNAPFLILSGLISKSLLRRTLSGRYDMHEVIRLFVWEKLQANEQEYEQLQIKYCEYFAHLLASRGAGLKGGERSIVVPELIAELANLRQTWHWASAFQNAREISQASDTLFWLYESRSNCREGVPLFGVAVDSLQQNQQPSRDSEDWTRRLALGQALGYQGFFLFRQGKQPQGRETLNSSLNILETISQHPSSEVRMALSNTLAFLGTVAAAMGDFADGDRLLQEGLSTKESLEDPWGSAFCLRQIGLSAYYQGDYANAYRSSEQSLLISRQIGNAWSTSASLNQLGIIAQSQARYDQARQYLLDGLELSRSLEDRASIAFALDGLGLISTALGRSTEAQDLLKESVALWREIGEQGSLAQTLNHFGDAYLKVGNGPAARECFSEALRVAKNGHITPILLDSLLGEAEVQIQEGKLESVLQILIVVGQSLSGSKLTKDRTEKLRVVVEKQLPKGRLREIKSKVADQDVYGFANEKLETVRV